MSSIPFVSVFILIAIVGHVASSNDDWQEYKQTHQKVYSSRLEESSRRMLFERRKASIEEFNAKEAERAGYTRGLNHLSDWTDEELAQLNGLRLPNRKIENSVEAQEYVRRILEGGKPVPAEIDWRKVEGRVSQVYDQGSCGSCWAFAAAGVLEGQETKRNVSNWKPLSEQELLDCPDMDQDNLYGCLGGDMVSALNYVAKKGGIEDSFSYPYTSYEGKCVFDSSKIVMTTKSGALLEPANEDNMKIYVGTVGPIATGIAAHAGAFREYQKGIFSGPCHNKESDLNHAVLIVGYGTDKDAGDYWIVKNSWGEDWGESGYIRLSRNKNLCGIALYPTIPVF